MRRRLLAVPVSLTFAACSSDPEGFEAPALGTDHIVYGTAQAGRALEPGGLLVVPASGLTHVQPAAIAGGDIDMVYAGLSAADLPVDLAPEALEFVSERDDRARPLPPLRSIHVLESPGLPDDPNKLVPVEVMGASSDLLADRRDRLEVMLNGVQVRNPCRDPTTPIQVTTPRIPADAISTMHTVSTGEVLLGLSISSTVAFGLVRPGRTNVELVPVDTGTVAVVEQGESAVIRFLTPKEQDSARGKTPEGLTVEIIGGFGSVGVALRYDPARHLYRDVTPRLTDAFPRSLFGIGELDLSGRRAWCIYGGVQGADRRAAIWCLPEGTTEWIVTGDFPRSFGITRLFERADGTALALDLAGGVYQLENERWSALSTSAINSGCDPLCASFTTTALAPESSGLLGLLGGAKAQLLLVSGNGEAKPIAALSGALFADERPDGDDPIRYSAAEIAPDGSIYLATTRPELFRVSPDQGRVERICLPKSVRDTPIASVEASPDGRLLLGFSPALLAFGRWDDL